MSKSVPQESIEGMLQEQKAKLRSIEEDINSYLWSFAWSPAVPVAVGIVVSFGSSYLLGVPVVGTFFGLSFILCFTYYSAYKTSNRHEKILEAWRKVELSVVARELSADIDFLTSFQYDNDSSPLFVTPEERYQLNTVVITANTLAITKGSELNMKTLSRKRPTDFYLIPVDKIGTVEVEKIGEATYEATIYQDNGEQITLETAESTNLEETVEAIENLITSRRRRQAPA